MPVWPGVWAQGLVPARREGHAEPSWHLTLPSPTTLEVYLAPPWHLSHLSHHTNVLKFNDIHLAERMERLVQWSGQFALSS
jgi:hypothetical protein